MDLDELDRIRLKKEPLMTEMRRYIQARLVDEDIDAILREVPWDPEVVRQLVDKIKAERKPERYFTSLREPLETDKY